MSTTSARLPSVFSCWRRNSASWPLVSSVARTAMTLAMSYLFENRRAANFRASADTARSMGSRSVDDPVQKPWQVV